MKDVEDRYDQQQDKKRKKGQHMKEQKQDQKSQGAENHEKHYNDMHKPFMLQETDLQEMIGQKAIIGSSLFEKRLMRFDQFRHTSHNPPPQAFF